MPDNITFEDFFPRTSESDRAFLSVEDLSRRFVPSCCAMANGAGGWVICGVSLKDDGFPEVEGVDDAESLEKQMAGVLSESVQEPAGLVSYFRTISGGWGEPGGNKKILAARVEPAGWRSRPVCAGKSMAVYRRVEGENLISGQSIRWRMALDALETSRDDVSVPGLDMSGLDGDSVASFREHLSAMFPERSSLSVENFLKRALVLDENGGVTRAGELLLGKNTNLVRLSLRDAQKIQNIPNLWSACGIFLPLISSSGFTVPCADALRECFINAMLHAEHDAGVIAVEFGDGKLVLSNSGLPRSLADGESEARNYRLMRIFIMAGLAKGHGQGLEIIRKYDSGFSLSLNTLELVTVSELHLPAGTEPGEPVLGKPTLGEPVKKSFANPGWLPLVQEKLAELAAPMNNPEVEAIGKPLTGLVSYSADEAGEFDDADVSEDDEYLGTDGAEDNGLSPLVRQVRETPRMPLAIVREAILELCSDYKSLSELASILARSEGSLRRHYITSMIREGLLEMEFPDRVGHPDQRYKAIV